MASITITSSYAGDALKKYILQALIGGETLSTNGISVLTNVKYKRTLKKLASSNVVQTNSCDFSPTSGVTISEAQVEPKAFMVNESICFTDIWDTWDSADMAAGMHDENLPQELVDGLTMEYVNQTAKELEEAVWQGSTTGSTSTIKDLFYGFEKILEFGHAASCTGNTVTTTGLTVSNVVTNLNAVYAAVPDAIIKKPKGDLVIFMSHKGLSYYEMNLATQGQRTSIEGGVPTLYGIEIKPVGGMSSDNAIVIGERSNFYIATDLESDLNQIKMLDQRDVDGSEKVNFVLRAKADVQIAYPCEVVWGKP